MDPHRCEKCRSYLLEYRSLLVREEVQGLERIDDLGRLELLMARLPELVGSPLSANALRENGLALPEGVPLVIMVARFAPIKGHRVLISAAGILKRRNTPAHFLLVGYPKDYTADQFKRWFVEGNLVDAFTVIDRRLPRLPALLARCDLGVIASLGSETVSRSLWKTSRPACRPSPRTSAAFPTSWPAAPSAR